MGLCAQTGVCPSTPTREFVKSDAGGHFSLPPLQQPQRSGCGRPRCLDLFAEATVLPTGSKACVARADAIPEPF
jgi:hypothetical protein